MSGIPTLTQDVFNEVAKHLTLHDLQNLSYCSKGSSLAANSFLDTALHIDKREDPCKRKESIRDFYNRVAIFVRAKRNFEGKHIDSQAFAIHELIQMYMQNMFSVDSEPFTIEYHFPLMD